MNKIIISLLLSANAFAFSPYAEVEKTKNNEKKLYQDVQRLKTQINEQAQIIEGMTSLNSGLSQRISELERKKDTRPDSNTEMIKQLATMIDDINSNYITKDELIKVVEKLEQQNKTLQAASAKNKTIRSDKMYKEALTLYKKKNYSKSKEILTELLNRGYKESLTNFYLGEIEYYSSKYPEAINYYKKSVSLNDKGEHMSMLMYHSGYSLEQIKDKNTAVSFYKSIVDSYQGKYVDLAKKRLKALKVI